MQIAHREINFLREHRICVITSIIPDGMPHAAVVHYAVRGNPLTLFFSVDNRSITASNVMINSNTAVVVGLSEENPITAQMRGEAHVVAYPSEFTTAKTTYYARYPHSQQFESDPHTVFLAFFPQWLRFSDPKADPSLHDFFKRGLQDDG